MEQRYGALAAVHGKLTAEKERLHQENETLREVRLFIDCGNACSSSIRCTHPRVRRLPGWMTH